MQRMNKVRLHKKIGMMSNWKKKKRKTSKFVDATGMREKGINNMEWIDREEWRRKIKLQVQKDVKTLIHFM